MKKKELLILIVILGIVVAGYLIFGKIRTDNSVDKKGQKQTQNLPQNENSQVKVRGVPKNELPNNFPLDIPMETGAEVTLNFNAINANGENQSSREFISQKTVAENYDFYKKVLADNGWKITYANDKASAGSIIIADKGNDIINIRIYLDASQEVRVSINNITANK